MSIFCKKNDKGEIKMEWVAYIPMGVGASVFLCGYVGTVVCLVREQRAWKRKKMKDIPK
jgi:hypothetical protein